MNRPTKFSIACGITTIVSFVAIKFVYDAFWRYLETALRNLLLASETYIAQDSTVRTGE